MSHTCPSCKADLPGFVSQETLTQRLGEKQRQIDTLTTDAAGFKAKADAHDTLAADLTRTKAELEGERSSSTKYKALASRGFADPRKAAGFQAIYDAEMAGRAKKDVVAFDAWLDGEAKEHPFLAPHYASTTADPKGADPKATAGSGAADPGAVGGKGGADGGKGGADPSAAKSKLPASSKGAATPGSPGRTMTAQQVREAVRTPEFTAMKPEDQRKKIAEWEAEAKASSSPAA